MHTYPGYRSIWGRIGGIITTYNCDVIAQLFLKGHVLPMVKGFWVCELRFRICMRNHDFPLWQLTSVFGLPALDFLKYKNRGLPWLVWLSGLSAGLRTKGSLV